MDEEKKTEQNEQCEHSLSKEEILARSRLENKNGDEMYKKNSRRALIFGIFLSVLFFMAIFIVEQLFAYQVIVTPAVMCIIWAVPGSISLFNGIFNKNKKTIIVGIICLVVAIISYVVYINYILH